MKPGRKPRSIADRFWEKVDMRGPNDCWPWKGALNDGYGWFYVSPDRGSEMSNRIAFELANGHVPIDCALHICDNPPCCNPAHLFDGSHVDNTQDMIAKGRRRSADQVSKGEELPQAKLTCAIVRIVRASPLSASQLGKALGVSKSTIKAARSLQNWRHVI